MIQNGARHPVAGLVVFAILFLAAGVLNTIPLLLRFFSTRRGIETTAETTQLMKNDDAVGFADAMLRKQSYENAKARLDELAEDAVMLVRLAPTEGANEHTASHLWNTFVRKWKSDVMELLKSHWDIKQVGYFSEADGFNKHEPVGSVLGDSADTYRELLYHQRNLKNLRHQL